MKKKLPVTVTRYRLFTKATTIFRLPRTSFFNCTATSSGTHQLTFAGHFKDSDNVIIERDAHGTSTVRFAPPSALVTPELIERACSAYTQAIRDGHTDPLLAIAMFILDFICIHPFNDGNGRMSRLLTLLMLCRNGYMVGKYISIEHLIEQSKSTYYEALAASTQGWDDNANDYAPFTNYLLGIILSACKEFDERINLTAGGRAQGAPRVATKGTRIEALLDQSLVPLSKADILARMPDTSTTTIERTLKSLLDSGTIIKNRCRSQHPLCETPLNASLCATSRHSSGAPLATRIIAYCDS